MKQQIEVPVAKLGCPFIVASQTQNAEFGCSVPRAVVGIGGRGERDVLNLATPVHDGLESLAELHKEQARTLEFNVGFDLSVGALARCEHQLLAQGRFSFEEPCGMYRG